MLYSLQCSKNLFQELLEKLQQLPRNHLIPDKFHQHKIYIQYYQGQYQLIFHMLHKPSHNPYSSYMSKLIPQEPQ